MKDDPFRISRQGARGNRYFDLPEPIARAGLISEDLLGFTVPTPIRIRPVRVGPDVGILAAPVGQQGPGSIGHEEGDAVGNHNLPRVFTALVRQQRPTGRGVEDGGRLVDTKGHIHAVAHRHEPAQQMCRAALKRVLLCVPLLDLTFP